jgi:hypothetical protein
MAMDDALTNLALTALHQREVGVFMREDGRVLLAYPLDQGVAVGLGTGPGYERRLRSILRKRAQNLQRFGKWLPVMFNDGSCFVMTRVADVRPLEAVCDSETLAAAEELIA